MTIKVLQNATGRGTGTTQTASFSNQPVIGNAIIGVVAMNNDGGIGSFTDNQGNATYTNVISQRDFSNSANSSAAACAWLPFTQNSSGTFTVTCTPTNGAGGGVLQVMILEVAGLSGTVDQTGGDNGGGLTPVSVSPTCTAPNTQANVLAVYAMVATFNAANGNLFSAGPSNSWINVVLDTNNNVGIVAALGYKIVQGVEITTATSQTLIAGTKMSGMVATFDGSGTGLSAPRVNAIYSMP